MTNVYTTNYETHELLSNPLSMRVVPEPTNLWGEAVLGAQLSIVLNTNVLSAGSMPIVDTRIRNLSSDSFYILDADALNGTSVFLTNSSGASYKLTPIGSPMWDKRAKERIIYPIIEGNPRGWSSPLMAEGKIAPGNYICYATRNIYTPDNKGHELRSNFVLVQVK
jgi:hypothetical protein